MPQRTDVPHFVVTGASGFVAQGLLQRHLLPLAHAGRIALTTTDLHMAAAGKEKVTHLPGDIADPALWRRLFARPVHRLFHLAAVVSGQAEREPMLGRNVNLLAGLQGMECARLQWERTDIKVRWIQASSIAVWGTGLPARVDDHHPVRPMLSYGTHKRVLELQLDDLSRRGEVDGRSLRLSGVVVRPRAYGAALSAFNSDVIREPLQGRTVICPVRPDACLWLCSRDVAADQLWQLSEIDEPLWRNASETHATGGAVNAPTWPVSMQALLDALQRVDAAAATRIRFDPAAPLHAQFGAWPRETDFALARALGLPDDARIHQHDLARFVQACMQTA